MNIVSVRKGNSIKTVTVTGVPNAGLIFQATVLLPFAREAAGETEDSLFGHGVEYFPDFDPETDEELNSFCAVVTLWTD